MEKQTTTLELNINGKDAERELERLQKRANDLKNTWASLAKERGIDDKKTKEVKREIESTEKEIRKMQKGLQDVNSVLSRLDSAKPKELQQAMRQLENALNSRSIERGSEQWKTYQRQLGLVKTQLQNIREESKQSKSWIDRFNDGMNQWQTTIATVVAGIIGLYQAIMSLRSSVFEKEDSKAKIAAITGLDEESIKWLQKEAEIMATTMDETGLRVRQSASEIVDAMRLVGANKPELLKDKEGLAAVTKEVLRLSQAADISLTEATMSLTTALNQFGQGADSAAKYVNALAAGSRYGAADVTALGKVILRSGVAANMAKVPFEQLVGMTEALAESGLKGERAGTGLKTFLMRLETGAEETRPSVVGLDNALVELAKHADDATWMKQKFGMVATNVAVTLAKGAEKVKYYTNAVTDTKVAEEQAAIMGSTAAAKHAQLANQLKEIGIEFYNKVGPAILSATRGIANWTRVMIQAMNFMSKYKYTLIGITTALAGYTIAMKANVIWQKLVYFWNNMIVSSFIKLKAAMMSNPWGALVVVIGTLIGLLADYFNNLEKVSMKQKVLGEAMDKINQKYNDEYAKIRLLRNALTNENIEREKKLGIIKKLQKIIPGYTAELDKEGRLIRENVKAIDEYLKRFKSRAEMQVWQEQYQEVYKTLTEKQNDIRKLEEKAMNPNIRVGLNGQKKLKKYKAEALELETTLKGIMDKIENIITKDGGTTLFGVTDEEDSTVDDEKLKIKLARLEAETAKEKNILAEYLRAKIISQEEYDDKIYNLEYELLNKKQSLYDKDSKEWIDVEKQKFEKSQERILKLAKAEENANKVDEKEQIEQEKKEQKRADKMLKEWKKLHDSASKLVNKYSPAEESVEDELALADKLKEKRMISEEQYDNIVSALNKKRSNAVLAEYDKQNQHIKKSYEDRQKDLKQMCDEGKITYEDYTKRKKQLDEEWKESMLKALETFSNAFVSILSNLASYYSAVSDLEVSEAEKSWDQKIAAAEKANKDTTALEAQKEEDVARIKSKYQDKATKIQIAMAIAQGAQAVINAYSSAAAIPMIGFVMAPIAAAMAAVATALQIATIKKQAQATKAGYYEGGYTSGSNYKKEAGVVHEGEFVGNHEAVNNPYVKNVFDLIDRAQKNNTVGSLTQEDIALANARQSGMAYSQGGFTSKSYQAKSSQQVIVQRDDNYEKLANAIDTLCTHGVEATVSMTGKNGIARKTKEYNKYNSNKSR